VYVVFLINYHLSPLEKLHTPPRWVRCTGVSPPPGVPCPGLFLVPVVFVVDRGRLHSSWNFSLHVRRIFVAPTFLQSQLLFPLSHPPRTLGAPPPSPPTVTPFFPPAISTDRSNSFSPLFCYLTWAPSLSALFILSPSLTDHCFSAFYLSGLPSHFFLNDNFSRLLTPHPPPIRFFPPFMRGTPSGCVVFQVVKASHPWFPAVL